MLGPTRHDFLSENSISKPLTASNDQVEKAVIAERRIDFSFIINPKWKETCSFLSRQIVYVTERERKIIIKITQINLRQLSCHQSALSLGGKYGSAG